MDRSGGGAPGCPDCPGHLQALVDAGILDAGTRDADPGGRVAAVHLLLDLGVPVEQIAATASDAERRRLARTAVRHRGARTLTTDAVAARAGSGPQLVRRIWRSAGFVDPPANHAVFYDDDVAAIAAFEAARAAFGEDALLQFTRVIGSALRRVADAAASMFLVEVEDRLEAAGVDQLELMRAGIDVNRMLLAVPAAMARLFWHHLDAVDPRTSGTRGAAGTDTAELAVGFVDLVDYTGLSNRLEPAGLAAVVRTFEAAAAEAVVQHGGQVVKFIGDEVMFVCADPRRGYDSIVALAGALGADELPVRAALAYGPVLRQEGDYYGRPVNLASRALALAAPGEVVLDAGVAGLLPGVPAGDLGFVDLKGFPEPVTLHTAPLLADAPAPPQRGRGEDG